MKLTPLADHVILKPLESSDKTAGGILLPDAAKEKATKGEVVAVGPGRTLANGRRVDMLVKVGDRVIYGKYAGNDVKIDGQEYKILQEGEILAVVN